MKALHCPIDTSLNFTQVCQNIACKLLHSTVLALQARKLVRDIRPKMVVVPEKYTVPPVQAPGRTELVVDTEVR